MLMSLPLALLSFFRPPADRPVPAPSPAAPAPDLLRRDIGLSPDAAVAPDARTLALDWRQRI